MPTHYVSLHAEETGTIMEYMWQVHGPWRRMNEDSAGTYDQINRTQLHDRLDYARRGDVHRRNARSHDGTRAVAGTAGAHAARGSTTDRQPDIHHARRAVHCWTVVAHGARMAHLLAQ